MITPALTLGGEGGFRYRKSLADSAPRKFASSAMRREGFGAVHAHRSLDWLSPKIGSFANASVQLSLPDGMIARYKSIGATYDDLGFS